MGNEYGITITDVRPITLCTLIMSQDVDGTGEVKYSEVSERDVSLCCG